MTIQTEKVQYNKTKNKINEQKMNLPVKEKVHCKFYLRSLVRVLEVIDNDILKPPPVNQIKSNEV